MSEIEKFELVCPHTLEPGFPVDGGDAEAHTNCDCPKVRVPVIQMPIPIMTGPCGDFVDRINQKLQVLICKLDGDAEGERLVEEIAKELREHYKEHRQ